MAAANLTYAQGREATCGRPNPRKCTTMSVSRKLFFSSLLVFLGAAASTPAAHAGDRKPKSDWDAYFGAGIVPEYPLTGVLKITRLGDYHASYTDADGHTISFHCTSDEYDTDCYDGPGLSFELDEPDGSSISVSRTPWIDQDPLQWMLSSGDALFEKSLQDAKSGRIFHFRWKDAPSGGSIKLLCVPIAGTESIPDGKARKEYAKSHRMESCYFATPMFGPTLKVKSLPNDGEGLTQQEQFARIKQGQASIVFVVTVPEGAEIWVDGVKAGASPMSFVLTRHGDSPRSTKILLNGYKTVERKIVPDGKTKPITLTLEPN